MSTSVWRPVRAELRRWLLDVDGVPDIHMELQRPRKPVVGVAHIAEKIEIGEATPGPLDGFTREDGIYQIDVWWPAANAADGEDLADKIRLRGFPVGRGITLSNPYARGNVLVNSRRSPFQREGWLVFPVRVSFYFYRHTSQGRFA